MNLENCWKLSGFIQTWFAELPNHQTYIDAYEAIEDKFYKKYKRRRYKNYKTFKACKTRYLKTK